MGYPNILPISLLHVSGGGINCVSCDISVYHLGLFVFFPGVFLSSRVTGACPVTTDLTIIRLISLLITPGETDYSDCHLRKTTTYISHVVSITTHTHDRRKSVGEKKQEKKIR